MNSLADRSMDLFWKVALAFVIAASVAVTSSAVRIADSDPIPLDCGTTCRSDHDCHDYCSCKNINPITGNGTCGISAGPFQN